MATYNNEPNFNSLLDFNMEENNGGFGGTDHHSNKSLGKKKAKTKKGGRKKDPVWNDYNIGTPDGNGHYGASCKYCLNTKWQRGRPATMMVHLAFHSFHCKGPVPDNIRSKCLVTLTKSAEKSIGNDDGDYGDH